MTADRPRPGGVPVERTRNEHPAGDDWRADAMAASRHSRLIDELTLPHDDFDRERAIEVCSQIARNVLRDFAPALILLPTALRRRGQVLAAYCATLFDFSLQTGVEGERLAALNRWEFDLERALDGDPPGQPVFVLLADENARAPWPRDGFDRLASAARERIFDERPATSQAADRRAGLLADGLALALSGRPLGELAKWARCIIRVRHLTTLYDDLRRGRPQLPRDRLPLDWLEQGAARDRAVSEAVASEVRELRSTLSKARSALKDLPKELRPAARYVDRTAEALLDRCQRAPGSPPQLGALARLARLAAARLAPSWVP